MIDIKNISHTPSLDEICEYVRNPVFDEFCAEVGAKYKIEGKTEYSKCSWMTGWNVKFKKSGKSLCTVYPNEGYFTVLVVVGKNEKEKVEKLLPECTGEIRSIYNETKEGNGQRWLMIDLEDKGEVYHDVMKFIGLRRGR